MSELVHSLNLRSEESIFKINIFENKYLIGALLLGIIMQTIVVVIPIFANVFDLVPLTKIQWIYTVGISILPIVIIEFQKKANEIKFGKVVYKNYSYIK